MDKGKKQHRVLVFTTPACGYCTKAKSYLRKSGIKFREIDITRDPEGARDVRRMSGGSSVPVIMVGHRAVIGFDRARLDDLLGIKNRPEEQDRE